MRQRLLQAGLNPHHRIYHLHVRGILRSNRQVKLFAGLLTANRGMVQAHSLWFYPKAPMQELLDMGIYTTRGIKCSTTQEDHIPHESGIEVNALSAT